MAESPSQQPLESDPAAADPEPVEYWCYHCDKRVDVEILADPPDVICHECKNGFVQSIAAAIPPPAAADSRDFDHLDDPSFSNQFIQVLRLIAQAAREEDAPPPPPEDRVDRPEGDYLRIELDGWDNDDDNEDDDDQNEVDVRNEGEEDNDEENDVDNGDGDEEDPNRSDNENPEVHDEEDIRRRRRDVLRLRLRDLATRAANRRNRILDWAEILMGLEDHSIELRLQMPEVDEYIGNPEDYVDAAGYEALLQNLAESDGRRGAPPASRSAVAALELVEVKSVDEHMQCAICKDSVGVGEMAKKLPCGHGYHEDCIVQWLGSRNSCPVCRFELETDDPDYEAERKSRMAATATGSGPSSSS